MRILFKIVISIVFLALPQLAYADSIADDYATGDTLTATKMNNIKSAVNDNDSRIDALDAANLDSRVTDLEAADLDNRITALEGGAPGTNVTTTAPTLLDDINAGYSEGTTWINVTSQQAYILVDSTAGSAIWKRITTAYAVGQIGPAGGIVISIDNDTGTEGIEVSPVDLGPAEWGCQGTNITGADGTEIYAGFSNTADIIADCVTIGIAARLADSYSLNGFDDWVLPSRDTLSELYTQRNLVGGLGSNSYWSSTEIDANNANTHDFVGGTTTTSNKNTLHSVRAIRSF